MVIDTWARESELLMTGKNLCPRESVFHTVHQSTLTVEHLHLHLHFRTVIPDIIKRIIVIFPCHVGGILVFARLLHLGTLDMIQPHRIQTYRTGSDGGVIVPSPHVGRGTAYTVADSGKKAKFILHVGGKRGNDSGVYI